MSEETKTEKPKAETLADAAIIARYEYIAALNYVNALMNNKADKYSARNIQRALFAAIDYNITDSKVKFTNKKEAELAGIFAKILDLRTILQANKINQLKEKENNEIKNDNKAASEENSATGGTSE